MDFQISEDGFFIFPAVRTSNHKNAYYVDRELCQSSKLIFIELEKKLHIDILFTKVRHSDLSLARWVHSVPATPENKNKLRGP
jgi:hypothetical protein